MNLHLKRWKRGTHSTLGRLFIDDVFYCYVLEDEDRNLVSTMSLSALNLKKIPGETAIPTGVYRILINFSDAFNRLMPLLVGVLGFLGVRIHKGNWIKNTKGCLLVGKTYDQDKLGYFRVWDSGTVFDPLYEKLRKVLADPNAVVTLTISQDYDAQ